LKLTLKKSPTVFLKDYAILLEDECGIQEENVVGSLWYKKGIRPVISNNRSYKTKSYFIALEVTPNKDMGKTTVMETKKKNSKTCIKFLKKLKNKYFIKNNKKVLLGWDNVSIHKSLELKQWLKENNKNEEWLTL